MDRGRWGDFRDRVVGGEGLGIGGVARVEVVVLVG